MHAADPRMKFIPTGTAADVRGAVEADVLGAPGTAVTLRIGETPDCPGTAVSTLVDPDTGRACHVMPSSGVLSYIGGKRFLRCDTAGILLRYRRSTPPRQSFLRRSLSSSALSSCGPRRPSSSARYITAPVRASRMDFIDVDKASVEPVDLADARLFCGISQDSQSEDSLLGILISSAREELELWTDRWMAARQVTFTAPATDFIGVRGPIVAVESAVLDDGTVLEAAVGKDRKSVLLPKAYPDHDVTVTISTGAECPPWAQVTILRMVRAGMADPSQDMMTPDVREAVVRHVGMRVR